MIWAEEVHSFSGVLRRRSEACVIINDDFLKSCGDCCGDGDGDGDGGLFSVQNWRQSRGKWWRLMRSFGCFVRIIFCWGKEREPRVSGGGSVGEWRVIFIF